MHWRLCGLHLFPIGSVTITLHSLVIHSCHPSKLPGLTTSPPQSLLLVKVSLAVHLDLSSSLGLRFPPLIVRCRRRISAWTSSSAFSLTVFSFLFYGTYSCVMMSMNRRTRVLHMKIAQAWRRLLKLHLSNPQPSHVTTVRPGCIQVEQGGFMMVSSLPTGPASTSPEHTNGIEIDEVRRQSRKTCRQHPRTDSFAIDPKYRYRC